MSFLKSTPVRQTGGLGKRCIFGGEPHFRLRSRCWLSNGFHRPPELSKWCRAAVSIGPLLEEQGGSDGTPRAPHPIFPLGCRSTAPLRLKGPPRRPPRAA